MSVEETQVVDFVTIDKVTGGGFLTISDHLPWASEEGRHLLLLQDKINTYLSYIEGGQLFENAPQLRDKPIAILIVSKYPLSGQGEVFFEHARKLIVDAGFDLVFDHVQMI